MTGNLRQQNPRLWEYIKRKKVIEYEYAEPYFRPSLRPLTEAELRQKVRTALLELPKDEWVAMQCELEQAYREAVGDGRPDVKDICADHD